MTPEELKKLKLLASQQDPTMDLTQGELEDVNPEYSASYDEEYTGGVDEFSKADRRAPTEDIYGQDRYEIPENLQRAADRVGQPDYGQDMYNLPSEIQEQSDMIGDREFPRGDYPMDSEGVFEEEMGPTEVYDDESAVRESEMELDPRLAALERLKAEKEEEMRASMQGMA